MVLLIKKLSYNFIFNFTLFLILMIGLQNSNYKIKVNLLISESVTLPLGFIIGTSFISGSILGSIIHLDQKKQIKEL